MKELLNFIAYINDGLSAAKIMNEELILMKLAPDGKVKFWVMSQVEPENADANDLKASFDKSLSKLNYSTRTS